MLDALLRPIPIWAAFAEAAIYVAVGLLMSTLARKHVEAERKLLEGARERADKLIEDARLAIRDACDEQARCRELSRRYEAALDAIEGTAPAEPHQERTH